jgi:hypothetical protein
MLDCSGTGITSTYTPKPALITLVRFLAELLVRIDSDGYSNSFTEFWYENLPADNTFYVAMRAYEQNGTPFCADFFANRPDIKIKKIAHTIWGTMAGSNIREVRYTGLYSISCTVYYEKYQ